LPRDKSKPSRGGAGSPGGHKRRPERPALRTPPGKPLPAKVGPERTTARGEKPGGKAPQFRPAGSGVAALYGIHAVREALRAGRRQLLAVYATEAAAAKLADDIARARLCPQIVEAEDLARRLGAGAVHQGVMLEASALPPLDITDIELCSGMVLVLDQITDPHNVGAILRTAAAFGVDGVVMTRRHAPDLAGIVAKAASGGLEHVAVASVTNLARALDRLGESGYLRIGLDSEADLSLAKAPLRRPLALVLGGEGKGLRRLSREKCDLLARLDMPGAIKSLNVSNACAVALTLMQTKEPG